MATTTEEEEKHIPTDLLTHEILSRIPAINLLRNHMLVSKKWRQLISSPEFIQIHLKRSNQRTDGTRILVADPITITDCDNSPAAALPFSGKRFYYPAMKPPSPGKIIAYPSEFSGRCPVILGSCDGLICLYDEGNRKFAVFNPSTRKYDLGLADKFRWLCLSTYASWFGRHPCTGEYVLVIGSQLQGSHVDIRVYALKTHKSRNSRSIINQKKHGRSYRYSDPVGSLLHGALHWAVCTLPFDRNQLLFESEHLIVAYDFRKNEIVEIPPPGEFRFTLGVMDECLFVIFSNADKVFELWSMREYGVKESWTKYANIKGFVSVRLLVPLGFCSNGDELIVDADKKKVEKYSFIKKKSTLLKNHRCDQEFKSISYVDSLVPPEIIYE
ncbi:hypothetical protein ABFS83_14G037300 [Erythranthe nasuta]